MASREQLKRWFSQGAYPTGNQFAELIDSFVHNSDGEIEPGRVRGLTKVLTGLTDLAGGADAKAEASGVAADAAQGLAVSLQRTLNGLIETIGKPGGVAALDDGGKVPSRCLPSYVDDVVEFDVMDPDSDTYLGCYPEVPEPYDDASTYSLQYDSLEGLTGVRYAPGRGFAAGERVAVYSGHNRVGVLYINSEGQDLSKFGDAADDGFVTPVAGKIYVAVTTDKQYRWGGSQLAELSGPTPIGDGWNEAFQGSAGAELQAKVNQLESDVSVRKGDLMYITAGWVFPVSADSTPMTLDEALDYVAGNIELLARWALPFYGWVISFVSDSGWKYYRYISSVDSNYSAEEIAEALRDHASWEQVDMGTGGSGGSGGSDDTGGNGNACSCEQCDANAAALSTLSGRVTAAESAVENAKAAANAAKSAADGAASAVEDMSATVDALGADVTEAQAAANLAKTTAIAAKTAADNAASDVEGLTTEVGALKTTVDSLGSGGTATDSVEFLDTTEATGYTQGAHTSGLTYLYPEAGAQLNLRAKPSAQDILLMLPVEESFAGKIFRVLDPRRLSSTEKASAKSVHITTYSGDYKIYGTTKASDDFWISLKGGYVELLAVKTVAGQSGVMPRVEWIVKQLVEF